MLAFFTNAILLATITATSACECGIEGSASRVFGGTIARANKYPWLAHIEIRPGGILNYIKSFFVDKYLQCGGTLIDETHLITAAHCVIDEEGTVSSPSKVDVFLGTVIISDKPKPVSVSSIIVDPKYDKEDIQHDFAILTLSEPVTYSRTVGPICLPNDESNLTKLIITGWGVTAEGSRVSDDLMEAEVDYLDTGECIRRTKNYLSKLGVLPESTQDDINMNEIPNDDTPDTFFCAINKKSLANSCQGDSGGPIMKQGNNGRYYLMGAISSLLGHCGEKADVTGFYTRTLYYKETIKSIAPNACWQD